MVQFERNSAILYYGLIIAQNNVFIYYLRRGYWVMKERVLQKKVLLFGMLYLCFWQDA